MDSILNAPFGENGTPTHVSCVICHMLCVTFLLLFCDKLVELVGGGFVINEANS